MRPVPLDNPPNPWSSAEVDYLGDRPELTLQVYEDHARSILSRNESPDIGFRWSVNAYRGCLHSCAYCYARPTHEYLGFGPGSDFDRKIVVKPAAAELLREAFERPSWAGELVCFSGNTDCYQPLEASYGLTRGCLEVCAEYRNPVVIITKSALIERDLGLLVELHRRARVTVCVSVAFVREDRARALEPHVTTPARRMKIIERLSAAGIPVCVLVAPIIPGLNDEEVVDILKAARAAGATHAARGLLRLPGSTQQVFEERLRAALPLRAERVLARTREVRGGELNDPRFGSRHTGEGEYARAILTLFDAAARRLGFLSGEQGDGGAAASTFRRPTDRDGQLRLFE